MLACAVAGVAGLKHRHASICQEWLPIARGWDMWSSGILSTCSPCM